jgi:riboflavin synthase
VRRIRSNPGGARLAIECAELVDAVKAGASIAVNGVCLTVAHTTHPIILFDVIAETLRRSALGELATSDRVNLERSLQPTDRIDGHFVQGHADGTARLTQRDTTGGEHILWFEPDPDLLKYIVPKGSIAIDGVSLTIAAVADNRFSVALIPTTLGLTALLDHRVGQRVNIETDILARTVIHYLDSMRTGTGVTWETLKEQGYA